MKAFLNFAVVIFFFFVAPSIVFFVIGSIKQKSRMANHDELHKRIDYLISCCPSLSLLDKSTKDSFVSNARIIWNLEEYEKEFASQTFPKEMAAAKSFLTSFKRTMDNKIYITDKTQSNKLALQSFVFKVFQEFRRSAYYENSQIDDVEKLIYYEIERYIWH